MATVTQAGGMLTGKVAAVTGAASGIGRAIALRLAADGAHVACLDRNIEGARATAQAALEAGASAGSHQVDITDEAQIAAAVEELRQRAGPIDILVNAAGVVSPPGQPFTDNTAADWDRVLDVNVKGAFFMAKACVADMKAKREGRIVSVSSITGVISAPFLPPYSVSKAALNSLTKVLARDLAKDGVTVNAVAPGYIWTDLWTDLGRAIIAKNGDAFGATPREVFDNRVKSLVPMQREQTLGDVAAAVAFFCSPAAKNITGQVLGVDGGVTI